MTITEILKQLRRTYKSMDEKNRLLTETIREQRRDLADAITMLQKARCNLIDWASEGFRNFSNPEGTEKEHDALLAQIDAIIAKHDHSKKNPQ